MASEGGWQGGELWGCAEKAGRLGSARIRQPGGRGGRWAERESGRVARRRSCGVLRRPGGRAVEGLVAGREDLEVA